jgi:hypothetical protein
MYKCTIIIKKINKIFTNIVKQNLKYIIKQEQNLCTRKILLTMTVTFK